MLKELRRNYDTGDKLFSYNGVTHHRSFEGVWSRYNRVCTSDMTKILSDALEEQEAAASKYQAIL